MTNKQKLYGLYFIAFLTIIILLSIYLYTPLLQYSKFSGNAESFSFIGNDCIVEYSTSDISFMSDKFEIIGIKNVVMEKDGKRTPLNITRIITLGNSKHPLLFSNSGCTEVEIAFENISLYKQLDYIEINGVMNSTYMNTLKYQSGETFLNVITIKEIKNDFMTVTLYEEKEAIYSATIFFEWSNNSEVWLKSENTLIRSSNVSNFDITKQSNSKISHLILNSGEGSLELDDHSFEIKGSNVLDIRFLPLNIQEQNFFINNNEMEFRGYVNHARLNTEDIKIGNIEYCFKKEPERINAYAVSILVIITLWQTYLSYLSSNQERKNRRRFIVKKYINPFHKHVGKAYQRLSLINDKSEDCYCNQYFKEEDCKKFYNMLDSLEIYLDNDDYHRIIKYEEKFKRFYLGHRRMEDNVDNKYAFECLEIGEACELFKSLLIEIKEIEKKYSS